MMHAVYRRKSKPVEVFIIFSHITFILWTLGLLIGTVVLYVNMNLPWVFLAGFILFLLSLLVYTFNISIILCLHSIIASSTTEMNNLPIFPRADTQVMKMTRLSSFVWFDLWVNTFYTQSINWDIEAIFIQEFEICVVSSGLFQIQISIKLAFFNASPAWSMYVVVQASVSKL